MPFHAILLAIALLGSDTPKGRADKELHGLQGEWTAISFEANGEAVPVAQAGWKASIKGSRIAVRFGLVSFDGIVVVDYGGKQRAMEITKTTGQMTFNGQTVDLSPGSVDLASIYKREGNRLTVCFRFGTTRPSEFQTRLSLDSMILQFERAK